MYILQLWFLLINTFKTIASLEQTCNALRLLPGENKLKFFFPRENTQFPYFFKPNATWCMIFAHKKPQ